jgi:hypothetical protein
VRSLFEAFDKEIQNSEHLVSRHMYCRAGIYGDFSILLRWDTAEIPQEASTLAYSLIQALSPLGMVDHSIWISQKVSCKE